MGYHLLIKPLSFATKTAAKAEKCDEYGPLNNDLLQQTQTQFFSHLDLTFIVLNHCVTSLEM